MADRGTVPAVQDASQSVPTAYEHVMEPTAAFGATVQPPYEANQTIAGTYAHPMEPTADFGNQFTGLYYGPW